MKPFQVNCSELIADFEIHEDKDVRELLKVLIDQYDIELYFEIETDNKEFCFGNALSFDIGIEHIDFKVIIDPNKYCESWLIKLRDRSKTARLIDSIEKFKVNSYGMEGITASSSIARELRDKIITMLPDYHTRIENKLVTEVNIDEVIDISIKLGEGPNVTTLRYGSNGYDHLLGWYFEAFEHWDSASYPFFEWAQSECNAKIRPFDGGSTYLYEEFLEKSGRERLW